MFRHTTKQTVRSQDSLRQKANKALDKDKQILCDSVYSQTYDTPLPRASVEMLDNIIGPLTGFHSQTDPESRKIYVLCSLSYSEKRIRVCFIQPEISTATAGTRYANEAALSASRRSMSLWVNNPVPARITTSKEKCQVAGRASPYVVSRAGLDSGVKWTYFNAAKSRILYYMCQETGVTVMSMTKETVLLYQCFCVEGCAIVYSNSTNCFKVTASPLDSSTDASNSNSGIFLYCDGSFKVLGTPSKVHPVCKLLRDTIVRCHLSHMHSRALSSLVPVVDGPDHC